MHQVKGPKPYATHEEVDAAKPITRNTGEEVTDEQIDAALLKNPDVMARLAVTPEDITFSFSLRVLLRAKALAELAEKNKAEAKAEAAAMAEAAAIDGSPASGAGGVDPDATRAQEVLAHTVALHLQHLPSLQWSLALTLQELESPVAKKARGSSPPTAQDDSSAPIGPTGPPGQAHPDDKVNYPPMPAGWGLTRAWLPRRY